MIKIVTRMMFSGAILLATTGILVSGASAGTHSAAQQNSCPSNAIVLHGGFCAVPVHGSLRAWARTQITAPDKSTFSVYIVNPYNNGDYVMTVQPTNSGGRRANNVYMWENFNYTTQRWTMGYDSTRQTYWFQSQYDGSGGGLSHACLNVPGSTRNTNVGLIVYQCGNYNNERFNLVYDSLSGHDAIVPYYTVVTPPNLCIGVGSGYPPHDGSTVITWTCPGISSNTNLQWDLPQTS